MKQYMAYLQMNWHAEEGHFLKPITINLTHYLRENYRLEYLADTVVSMLRKSHWCHR